MTVAVTISATKTDRHHYATIFAFDILTNTFSIGGVNAPSANDTSITVQGSASARARQTGTGINGVGIDFTNQDIEGTHLLAWVNNLDLANTPANGGWRIRIAANGAGTSDFGEFYVGGDDAVAIYTGFSRFCANIDRPFDTSTGTPAQLTGIGAMAIIQNSLTASTRDTWFTDEFASYRGIFVSAGTAGALGNSAEIAANDLTNGRGVFKSAQSAYYILGMIGFGDLANAASEFQDNNEVWLFEAQNVSGGFHGMEFKAGTGTNNAMFGTFSGSAADPEGAGGNFFKAVGDTPFHVLAEDNQINVGFYGCTLSNPPAAYWDAPRAFQYDDVGTGVTNETRDAGNTTAANVTIIPATEAVGDYTVIGHEEPFQEVEMTLSTAGVAGVVVWEYYNGSAWVALTDVTDESNGFKATGISLLQYSVPTDWATTTVGGIPAMYYVRARITTVYSTNPVGTQFRVLMSGRVKCSSSAAEFVRSSFSGMGAIELSNGPTFRKNTIVGSVNSPRHGAVVLDAVPTENDFSDLIFQTCKPAMLLKNTTTPGPIDYTLTDIQFSNNNLVVRAYDFDISGAPGSEYFDVTASMNDTSALQFWFFVAGPALNDALYIGSTAPFSQLKIDNLAGNWNVVLAWEYWNGTAWTAVSGLVDETNELNTLGSTGPFVTWTRPTDWIRTTEGDAGSGTDTQYFLRIRIATLTSHSIVPNGFSIQIPGDVRVDYPSGATINLELAGTTFATSGGFPQIDNVNGSTVNILNNVPIEITGVTRGTAITISSLETVGTLTEGDVLFSGFPDQLTGAFERVLNYEEAFDDLNPTQFLTVLIRCRNQGIFWECTVEDNSLASFTEQTTEAHSNTTNDMTLFPAVPGINDAYYFGYGQLALPGEDNWNRIKINVTTAMASSGTTLVWEYYTQGPGWQALPGLVDGTNGFTTLGENIISWNVTTLGLINVKLAAFFFVRVRISVLGTITVVPLAGRASVDATRFLPYESERNITPSGLAVAVPWTEDNISTF